MPPLKTDQSTPVSPIKSQVPQAQQGKNYTDSYGNPDNRLVKIITRKSSQQKKHSLLSWWFSAFCAVICPIYRDLSDFPACPAVTRSKIKDSPLFWYECCFTRLSLDSLWRYKNNKGGNRFTKPSIAGTIFCHKISSLSLQLNLVPFRSKIRPNGPEPALEGNKNHTLPKQAKYMRGPMFTCWQEKAKV